MSYNAAISACGRGTQWCSALHLLDLMLAAAQAPDSISGNAAINACEESGEWQRAIELLVAWMPAQRLPVTVVGVSSAISACAAG